MTRRSLVSTWARCCLVAGVFAVLAPVSLPPSAGEAQAAKRRADPVRQALSAIRRGRFSRARRAIRRVGNPFERDALLFALYRRDGNPAKMREIAGFIGKHPDWPLQFILRQRAEVALPGRVAAADLAAWFARHPPVTPIGCIRHIDLLGKRGDRSAAKREISRCWKSLAMPTSAEKKFFRRYGRRISHTDRAARVRMHLDRGRYRSAYRLILFHKLSAGYAVPLRVRIDLQRRPRPWTVPKMLKRIPKVPAKSRSEPGFRFDLVRWNRRRGELTAASAGLETAPEPGPAAAGRWWLERTLTVRELLKEQHYARAYAVAASHRQASGYRFAAAESLAGWIALRKQGRSEAALKHFQRIHAGSRRSDLRAMAAWWVAETWRDRHNPGKAEAWYQKAAPAAFSLHGQLSRMRLKERTLVLPPDTAIPTKSRAAFDREAAVRLTRFYSRNRASKESRQLLWWLIRRSARRSANGSAGEMQRTGRRLVLIAELAAELGERHIAVRAARRALPLGFVRNRLAYPVIALPKRLPVEPALVLAVIRQESEFNLKAHSRASARGLMQLVPSTAKFAARRARLKWSRRRLTRDAAYNIRLGSAYLDYLLDRFEGSYLLAAAAYNAGPARVARWIERYGDPGRNIEPIDWIESIPFGETRNFVRRVLANVAVYRARLGSNGLAATPVAAWRRPGSEITCSVAADCKKARGTNGNSGQPGDAGGQAPLRHTTAGASPAPAMTTTAGWEK
ncbi:MAG: lytic transglycosylase domain-containing protein [Rhodospirillaceae bacterium]|nr:lytic transglycosylase domain-containing protein [Rhodospirillaceae bacterium]